MLAKAIEPLGPDDHWITLKPHGPGSDDYVHVVIREHKDGTASIIRSPGGKLNYLHFSKLGNKEDWKENAKTRAAAVKAKEKERRATQTPEAREAEAKQAAAIDVKRDELKRDFVASALQTLGHDPESFFTPDSSLAEMAPEVRDRFKAAETRMAARKLDKVVKGLRDELGKALETIQINDLGETPLDILIPPAPMGGERMGYAGCVGERAVQEGLTVDSMRDEEADIKRRHYEARAAEQIEAGGGEVTPGAIEAGADILEDKARALYEAMKSSRESVVQAMSEGVIRGDIPETKEPDMDATLKLIQLRHDWKQKELAIRKLEKNKAADANMSQGGYINVDSGDIQEELAQAIAAVDSGDAARAVEDELRGNAQQRVAGEMFDALDVESDRATLGGHFAAGRYNVLNTFWQNVNGDALPFDRATIDTLGSEAAATLVVENMRANLSPEDFEAAKRGLAKWHSGSQESRAQQSMDEYEKSMQQYDDIKILQPTDSDTLIASTIQLDRKSAALNKARQTLGTTHGALETTAEMIRQMEYPPRTLELRSPLGNTTPEDAVKQARSIGLGAGDYVIDKRNGQTYLTVNPEGSKKLMRGIDPKSAERMRVVDAIKRGDADGGQGWLPAGIVSRPKTTFDDPVESARVLSSPVDIPEGATDEVIDGMVVDHVGERLCSGEPITNVRADLSSQSFIEAHVPVSTRPSYFSALEKHGLGAATDGEAPAGSTLESLGDAMAIQWASSHTSDAGVSARRLDDDALYEATFRTIAQSEPKRAWLFTPTSDLTRGDRKSLREFYGNQRRPEAWDQFVAQHDSLDAAYAEIQESAMGQFIEEFAKHYGQVTGKSIITSKVQMASRPEELRTSMGSRAEGQLASIYPYVGKSLPGVTGKIKIPQGLNMSEGDFVKQQRMIKLFLSQKRIANSIGVGGGKSLIALGAFTQGHAEGKFKRAIFAVPSSVQAQFGAECARALEPGKYRWFARPGASAADRRAAYKDVDADITVVTHEALRDDINWAVAQKRFKGDENQAAAYLRTAPRGDRQRAVQQALKAQGWDFGMAVVDEGHKLLNRKGKANSLMSNTIGGLTDGAEYYMPMSADPVKNDISEVHDFLSRIDPKGYPNPDEFARKYGANTQATAESLKREMGMHQYAERIDPPVLAKRQTVEVPLSPGQRQAYSDVNHAFAALRKAKRMGTVDVVAAEMIAPARFENIPDEIREETARNIQENPGIYSNRAYDRVVNHHPIAENAKIHKIVDIALSQKSGTGEQLPGVVFAHEIKPVKMIAQALEDAGLRVGVYTGELTGQERRDLQQQFQNGGPDAPDVIVASDAGAEGVQLERGAFVINANVPDTSKTHEQRIGRIERLGQKNPSINVFDVVTNTPYEHDKLGNLNKKKGLRDIAAAPTESLDDSGMLHELWSARQEAFQRDVAHAGVKRK